MNGITYGYIRVSSKDQNEDRQRIAMHDAGVDERHIFMDKQSGKDFDRPGWRRYLCPHRREKAECDPSNLSTMVEGCW